MNSHNTNTDDDSGDAFFVRMLVKTGLKAIIWCILAAIITYAYPSASWVWYVVIALVAIGLLVGMLGKFSAMQARKRKPDPN